MSGASTPVYWVAVPIYSVVIAGVSTVQPTNYFKYNPTSKILYSYNQNGTLAGYAAVRTGAGGSFVYFDSTTPQQTWTVVPDPTLANYFSFKNDGTNNYIGASMYGAELSTTPSTNTRFTPIFI
jgi:hypothetical protein